VLSVHRFSWCTFCYLSLYHSLTMLVCLTSFVARRARGTGGRDLEPGAPPPPVQRSQRDHCNLLPHPVRVRTHRGNPTTGDTSQRHATSATVNTSHKCPTFVKAQRQSQISAGLSTNSRRRRLFSIHMRRHQHFSMLLAATIPYQVMPPLPLLL
jgi:hypothetical protein